MSEQSERVIDLSVEVPGTPEQVWSAIATGPGISSWFIPHEVAEHEGGKVVMDFGEFGRETATVTPGSRPGGSSSPGRTTSRSPRSGSSRPRTAGPVSYAW